MKKYIFDNSNIAESYSGVTTPLTYSFARYAYQEVYKHFCKMMGVGAAVIEDNTDMFSRMIVFIGYRMYYDLINWYKLVSFLPGYKFNRGFFEKMLGVQESYADDPRQEAGFFLKYFVILPRLIFQTMGIFCSFVFMGSHIKSFNKKFDRVFREIDAIDLTKLGEEDLEDLFFRLHRDLVSQWRVPIANDFAVMVSTGIAEGLFKKWFQGASVYSFLYSKSHSPLISLDPGLQIVELASRIKNDHAIWNVFKGGENATEILKTLQQDFSSHPIKLLLEEYLKTFGSRTPNELKLESKTLNERPEILIELLRSLVNGGNDLKSPGQDGRLVPPGLERIKPLNRFILSRTLDWAMQSITRREETRLRRAMIFGFARKIFLAMGQRFCDKGALENVEDIFFLTTEDIFAFVKEKSDKADMKGLVIKRKKEFDSWRTINTPRRIETFKSVDELEKELATKQKPQTSEAASQFVKGVVASRPKGEGVIGTALVLLEFDPEASFAGKILVTKQTDPGWTVVFPLLKGLVVERGGMLSHAAIVARELNIPCVVGVDQATSFIKNGSQIRIDLGKGRSMSKINGSRLPSLPNVVSFLALFLSWVSILLLLNGRFYFSFSLVLLAFILDALDGYLARRLGQESTFGRQLDGFIDVFIFLIYPSLAFYFFLGLKGIVSTIIIFVFIATGIFRLARFNVTGFTNAHDKDELSYSGLPVFCNHITILLLLALRQFSGGYFFLTANMLLVLNSILMVQKFSFPKPRTLWPFILLILLVSGTMAWMELYGIR